VRHDFNAAILEEVAHRPWSMPNRPWVMTQTWHDLLFAHWPVNPQQLRSRVPPEFELDLFDGNAWIGIVPFHMTNVAPRGIPSLPWLSAFPELNVRTYVRVEDRPGVYFFSLDAGSSLAVRAARTLLNLPYYSALMAVRPHVSAIEYESRRLGAEHAVAFRATYEPSGPVFVAAPGSVEYFLTERYCLYHRNHRGLPYRLEIHHPPWPLQSAQGHFARNGMADANGLALPDRAPLLHFVKRQDMVAWAPMGLTS
jgi:uncharacterized protein YqjF (DUF2071 family)